MAQRGSPETVKRKELVGKLNETCLRAFSAAAQRSPVKSAICSVEQGKLIYRVYEINDLAANTTLD